MQHLLCKCRQKGKKRNDIGNVYSSGQAAGKSQGADVL